MEQLEALLICNNLPVDGDKAALTQRLRMAFDITPHSPEMQESQQRQSPPDSAHCFSARPPPKTYDYDSGSEADVSFSSTLTTPSVCKDRCSFGDVRGFSEGVGEGVGGEWIRTTARGSSSSSGGGDGRVSVGDYGTARLGGRLSEEGGEREEGDDEMVVGNKGGDEVPTTSERLFLPSSLSSSRDEQRSPKVLESVGVSTAAAAAAVAIGAKAAAVAASMGVIGVDHDSNSDDAVYERAVRDVERGCQDIPDVPALVSPLVVRGRPDTHNQKSTGVSNLGENSSAFFDTFSPRATSASCRRAQSRRQPFSLIGEGKGKGGKAAAEAAQAVVPAPTRRGPLQATSRNTNAYASGEPRPTAATVAAAMECEKKKKSENSQSGNCGRSGGDAGPVQGGVRDRCGDGGVQSRGGEYFSFLGRSPPSRAVPQIMVACENGEIGGEGRDCSIHNVCGALTYMRMGSGSLSSLVCGGGDDTASSLDASFSGHKGEDDGD